MGAPQTPLEILRRGLPLTMDGMGRFFFEGDEVTHPRVVHFLRGCLDLSDHGEEIVCMATPEGEQWAYLTVRDLPLRVLSVASVDKRPLLTIDDGRSLPLVPDTLREDAVGGLRCEFPARRSGRPLNARFTNRAQMALADWFVWSNPNHLDIEDLRPAIEIDGRRYEIPFVASPKCSESDTR